MAQERESARAQEPAVAEHKPIPDELRVPLFTDEPELEGPPAEPIVDEEGILVTIAHNEEDAIAAGSRRTRTQPKRPAPLPARKRAGRRSQIW